MKAGVAAGHPATVAAGVEILRAGGSAADAAVAASLASCVAETVMTGLLGGGHAIYFDAGSGRTRNLDFFVAVPGLGAEPQDAELLRLEVPFGIEVVHYAVGPASCGVPGVPAGLDALWREHGRLPWPRLFEPALALARAGVEMPPAHAACLEMLAPVMTMNEGARIYAPGGSLLRTGELLRQPGLAVALELLAGEGAGTLYDGSLADALLSLLKERGGLVTRADLAAYRPEWSEPATFDYLGLRFASRAGLRPVGEVLGRLPRLRDVDEAGRALALATALGDEGRAQGTTNLVVTDADGSACVLTTSLGLGSGDFVPGLDLHLNSMLGEADLVLGTLEPGGRMESMMAPSLAFGSEGVALAAGAAGGTRLRSALVQVIAGVLDEGESPRDAVARPRLHATAGTVHLEPGFAREVTVALEESGYQVREWDASHHYFGGVSLITPSGSAGDPRRSGAATVLG